MELEGWAPEVAEEEEEEEDVEDAEGGVWGVLDDEAELAEEYPLLELLLEPLPVVEEDEDEDEAE